MARRRPARLSTRMRRRTFRTTALCRQRIRVRWLWKQRTRVHSYKRFFREQELELEQGQSTAAGCRATDPDGKLSD